MKITISGWPGVGATTICLILADLINHKYIGGSGIFRYLGSKITDTEFGKSRIIADKVLEEQFGPIYDKYISYLISTLDNFVIDSDLAGFLNKNTDSVFIYANSSVREKRLKIDGRSIDVGFLKQRELSLRTIYKNKYNIDFFDLDSIKNSHKHIIDNSDGTITSDLEILLKSLHIKIPTNLEKYEELFWKYGKQYFIDSLQEKKLLLNPENMIKEIKVLFKKDLDNLPESVKALLI